MIETGHFDTIETGLDTSDASPCAPTLHLGTPPPRAWNAIENNGAAIAGKNLRLPKGT